MKTKSIFLLATVMLSVIFSIGYFIQPVSAYEIDTHYHWTFYLALYVGFDWDEAHLIASGNQRMDETKLVAGWIDKGYVIKAYPNNFDWHALSYDNSAKANRLADLRDRAFDETDVDMKLVKFGQYLHYLQDVEPHDTYGSVYGHAFAGHKPDSPGNDKVKFEDTTTNTLVSLNDLLVNLDRPPKTINEVVIRFITDEIFNNSKPGITYNGGRAENKVTIENAIKDLKTSENLIIPTTIRWDDDRPIIPGIIKGKFNMSDDPDRGEPTKHTWDTNQHHRRSFNVSIVGTDNDPNRVLATEEESSQASISILTNDGDTIGEFDPDDKGWSIVGKGDDSEDEESNDFILMKYNNDTWTDVIRVDFDTGNIGFENAIQAADIIESTSGGFKFPDGSVQSTSALPDSEGAFTAVPIGTVLDWWCSIDCTIPDGYALADGSIVNDPESQFDGETLPDLRDTFVRGVSTVDDVGEIGGTTSHTHTSDVSTDIVSAGSHTHTVDPVNTGTTSTGSHTHTVDPVNTGTTSDEHNHRWSYYNVSTNAWVTYTSSGSTMTLVDWGDGMHGEGSGYYPITTDDNDPTLYLYTDDDTHSHSVDIASTTSSSTGNHSHSVDIASTTSSSTGNHSHSASSSALIDTTSHEPPYVGLIKIIRIK